MIKIYLVGGAVRDKLLNRPIKDRDWVVVGATPDYMLQQGYQQVGSDFPVFIHPKSGEEYALARTERKSGAGYQGFKCYAGVDVSLEDDLLRRDLTINAMAESEDGHLTDPYNGQADLANKVLRHVSDAFTEDPLRVLRVARFHARYGASGFTIAEETMALMTRISQSGELNALTVERVWTETERALLEGSPRLYFETLQRCGALQVLFPDLNCLFGIPQTAEHHPEIDTGIHTLMVLDQSVTLSASLDRHAALGVRFAALMHDVGKGKTPKCELPSHHGHEASGEHLIKLFCTHYKVPTAVTRLAKLVARYHLHAHRAFELKPATLMRLLESLDAVRRPETLEHYLLACEADSKGRTGFESRPYPQADYLRDAAHAIKLIEPKALIDAGFHGKRLGDELRMRRIKKIQQLKEDYVTIPSHKPSTKT